MALAIKLMSTTILPLTDRSLANFLLTQYVDNLSLVLKIARRKISTGSLPSRPRLEAVARLVVLSIEKWPSLFCIHGRGGINIGRGLYFTNKRLVGERFCFFH